MTTIVNQQVTNIWMLGNMLFKHFYDLIRLQILIEKV